ncbi:MAG: class I SAM-dependent methyltransferase [Anaerolineae bacterium]|jgi:ubiquinone/menaquinone biosynthesis C-methylase UbiE
MKTIVREWDWWAYHYRVVHRAQIPGIEQWDHDLVDLIVQVLELELGNRVLDVACGSGEHARRLAERGMEVVGVDIAPRLVAYCQEQAAKQDITTAQFVQCDMRELAYDGEFDAVLLLSGSFGFYDEPTNEDVLGRIARALRPGGRVLMDVFDPTRMVVRPPRRSWSQYSGGFGLRTTWWEPESCTYVSEFMFIDTDGTLNTYAEQERIRVYTLPEWRALLAGAGLTMTHALADTKLPLVPYDRNHYQNLVLVAGKD